MTITFYSPERERETVIKFQKLAEKKGKSNSAYIIELMKQEIKKDK